MKKTVFIIGAVWVEPNSSAAGSRMLQLIEYFQTHNYQIIFGTTAQKTPNSIDLKTLSVTVVNLKLNDASFDELIKSISPEIVLFDRFMTEEQFGWRVAEHSPDSIRIIDTEDLHFLRKIREKKYKAKEEFQLSDLLLEDITKREVAAILRSDLSFIISQYEMDLLQDFFKIDTSLLFYLPFLLEDVNLNNDLPTFKKRSHFISIGNFLHPPNLNAVLQLKKDIWPLIQGQLPEVELHVYGAYPTQQILQLNNSKERFFVHGFVNDINNVLKNARVLLAPLSFGAGLKGKFIDAMKNGCPSVTTPIGIEGYSDLEDWCGLVGDNSKSIAEKAIQLYTNESIWNSSQEKGADLLKNFNRQDFSSQLTNSISIVKSNLPEHRKQNFMGSLLQHHTMHSTKYMSKWIEAKNKSI